MEKNKKCVGLFAVQVLVLLAMLIICIVPGKYYENIGTVNCQEEGKSYTISGVSLNPGTYNVRLKYDVDIDWMANVSVTDAALTSKEMQINTSALYSGLDETNLEMWLYRKAGDITISASTDAGTLEIEGVSIIRTRAMERCILFWLLLLFIALDTAVIYRFYDLNYGISREIKTRHFWLIVISIWSAAISFLDYSISGGDTGYHLLRVEGVKDGILSGQIPVRISPEWVQGHGYASPIFYGEPVIAIGGIFRIIGFSVTDSYRLMMAVVSIATVLIAFYCFKKVFESDFAALVTAALQGISIYRIYKLFGCGSMGEGFAVMLMPLFVYGFYRIFTEDPYDKKYRYSFIPLTLGFTLLLQTHLLSCELVGLFTIILCFVEIKKIFSGKFLKWPVFWALFKTVVSTIALSAWYLVPFLDYTITGDFVIKNVSARRIQERGLFLAHQLWGFVSNGSTVFFDTDGMYSSQASSLGPVCILAIVSFIILCLAGEINSEKHFKFKKVGIICAVFSFVSMTLSLESFPWDKIQNMGGVAATLVSSLQFPNRILTIGNICSITLIGVIIASLGEKTKEKLSFLAILAACFLCGNVFNYDNLLQTASFVRVFNNEGMGTGYVSGGEYLPNGSLGVTFIYHDPYASEGLVLGQYERGSLESTQYVENKGNETGKLVFDMLYYKGYVAKVSGTNQRLDCYMDDSFEVAVNVPGDFSGTVELKFVSPFYWRIAEIVSALSAVAFLIYAYRENLSKQGK